MQGRATDRFEALQAHTRRLAGTGPKTLLTQDPARAGDFSHRVGPLYVSFARQGFDRPAADALFSLLEDLDAPARLRALFDGEPVNPTEARPALHTALRGNLSPAALARDAHAQAQATRERMADLIRALEASEVTDIGRSRSVGSGSSKAGRAG